MTSFFLWAESAHDLPKLKNVLVLPFPTHPRNHPGFCDLLKIIHTVSVRSSPCDLHACGFWENLGRGPFRSHSVPSPGFREHRRVINNSRPDWGYRV